MHRAPDEDSKAGNDPSRSRWIINGGEDGIFDAVIVTVGTCGKPKWIHFEGMPENVGKDPESSSSSDSQSEKETHSDLFTKPIIHSSQLDSPEVSASDLAGKKIVVIGSGASGVEAVETALARVAEEGGPETTIWMVARSDKWIIPRNIVVDTFLACQPFGREMPLRSVSSAFASYFFLGRLCWH